MSTKKEHDRERRRDMTEPILDAQEGKIYSDTDSQQMKSVSESPRQAEGEIQSMERIENPTQEIVIPTPQYDTHDHTTIEQDEEVPGAASKK